MHGAVTVTVVEPVMVLFWVEVAVTVIKPTVLTSDDAVTSPPVEMVAADIPLLPGAIVQFTVVCPVLPSLKTAVTLICTALLPCVPERIVGVAGDTVIELTMGFTKNPRQLMARASVASAANALISRSLDFMEDMVSRTPWGTVPGSMLICSGFEKL